MMARRKSNVLSERQKRILRVLESFQAENGYPPSIREICDQANISSTSVVNYYLERLKEMGYIERESRVSRGIRLIKPLSGAASSVKQGAQQLKQAVEELFSVPIVGQIVAGSPMPVPQSDFSYYDADSMVEVASSLLPGGSRNQGLFALKVKGDSMIDAMVFEGDIVIMKPAKNANNGEMVAIWLNDKEETTLKYFYQENGQIRLQPANPTMDPIIIKEPSNVEIQGKVVMVIRQVKGLVS